MCGRRGHEKRLTASQKALEAPGIEPGTSGSTLTRHRPRPAPRSRQWLRSYAPSTLPHTPSLLSVAADESASPIFGDDEVFFDKPIQPAAMTMLPQQQPPGDSAGPSTEPAGGEGGFAMSRDQLDHPLHLRDQYTTRERPPSWRRTPERMETASESGPEVGCSRIWSRVLDRVFDNSDRRTYGMGVMGRFFGRSIKRQVAAREDIQEQLEDIEDHRPFFTYWVTTVQVLILIISLVCYGLGPIGIDLNPRSGQVLVTSLSLQQVDYKEPANFWIGPRAADLIHLGAKFAPCMRKDVKIIKEIEKGREKERETACCIRNDDSGCVQSSQADCSSMSVDRVVKLVYEGRVCGSKGRGRSCKAHRIWCRIRCKIVCSVLSSLRCWKMTSLMAWLLVSLDRPRAIFLAWSPVGSGGEPISNLQSRDQARRSPVQRPSPRGRSGQLGTQDLGGESLDPFADLTPSKTSLTTVIGLANALVVLSSTAEDEEIEVRISVGFCEAPASVAPYEWPDDITKWPICRKTNSNPQMRSRYKDKIADHMVCEVSCLDDVCGMIAFFSPETPDQFYRLWMSLFLHAGIFQLAITLVIQYFLMRDLEKLTGSLRIMIIYMGSGVAGNLASAIFVPYRADVGPSGAQFGLLACLIVEVLNAWMMLKQPEQALLKLIGITLVLFLFGMLPWVDNYAHLFGFIFGFLLSYALMPFVSFGDYDRQKKVCLVWVCLLSSLFLFTALVVLFYIIPVYDCEVCSYFNCVPLTTDFCASQNINFMREEPVV
uniref:(California timema) hypothetical protein n=1 Tax=Timema californicum TaxID=61474 RepID=A0A7R9P5H1_TIMCA|nr:unnamed protein product [Timema californicum]